MAVRFREGNISPVGNLDHTLHFAEGADRVRMDCMNLKKNEIENILQTDHRFNFKKMKF